MVIIDEFSMLKADMFYQLDLRLRELKQDTENPFGGCSIVLLGDILQLKPVMGRYIFEEPICEDYHISHAIDPLWKKMEVLFLTYNHCQGEDFQYAEILNRMRSGSHTEEDCMILQQRVRPMGHKDIPSTAMYIICTNAGVNAINESMLENMEGEVYSFQAEVKRGGKPAKNPRKGRDGCIFNTPLQMNLELKIGAQIMLTYNVDVIDSLTNGTIGHVVGFETSQQGNIKSILVKFKDEKAGREKRKKNSAQLTMKYHGTPVTPISKIEFRFNMSKSPTSQNDFMVATQFPLKLSFACTAHKMQGSTVAKPDSLAIDMSSAREASIVYVMMSRVQEVEQLFILDKFLRDKIYPSPSAMRELQRLQEHSLNEQKKIIWQRTVVTSLNVRSLARHHQNLLEDKHVTGNVLALQETWCQNEEPAQFNIPGYQGHFVNQGRGKGVATYYQSNFQISGTINKELYQMSRVSSGDLDVINIYLSRGASKAQFLQDLGTLAKGPKPCIIVGDFNIDLLKQPEDCITRKITSCGYKQIISSPTHVMGGALDHIYVKKPTKNYHVEINFPYYSDHASLSLVAMDS